MPVNDYDGVVARWIIIIRIKFFFVIIVMYLQWSNHPVSDGGARSLRCVNCRKLYRIKPYQFSITDEEGP